MKPYKIADKFVAEIQIGIEGESAPAAAEALLQIPELSGSGVEEILQKMGEAEEKFRENILAEELLKLQSADLRKMLGKLLVYELPVLQVAISPMRADISLWESHIERAASLGLLKVTLTNSNGGGKLYPVPQILEPLLKL